MFQICCFLLCILNVLCCANVIDFCPKCECDLSILEGKISEDNHRFRTFSYTLNILRAREAYTIVETGTARAGSRLCASDGCSTLIFAEWVKDHGGEFYSIDNNEHYLQNAADAMGDLKEFVHLILSDSVVFLENFKRPIDFLYLDSLDYDINNPNPSQEHHLKEIQAAYPWLTSKAVVMIDDCDLPGGGKGKLVIEYLLENGWKILLEGYQVILSQE